MTSHPPAAGDITHQSTVEEVLQHFQGFTPSWAFPATAGFTADMLSCSSCSAWTSLWNLRLPMEILSWEGQYIPKNTYTFYNDPIKGKDLRHITACRNH
jgi:hypothetical protein